jgi:SAM-dependent methyltransferase
VSRWDDNVIDTTAAAKRFWGSAPLSTLYDMMEAPRWAWERWLRVAAEVVTSPGLVFEPGCGVGLLATLLPPGCTYYGCDINQEYVREAIRQHGGPGRTFEVRDFDDVLDSEERFDWIVITSLFGMFPEREVYALMPRFWDRADRGMSVTTVDKTRMPRTTGLRHQFTAHDPEELMSVIEGLPDIGDTQIRRGYELPEFRGHHWKRGVAIYAWRRDR